MKLIKSFLAIAVIGFFALLPLSWAQALGRFLGSRFIANSYGNIHRITRKNIELAFPDLSPVEHESLISKSLLHTGMTFTEMGMSWLWKPSRSLKKIRHINNESILKEALGGGKGVIIIAPHIGNWEVLNLYISNHYPLTIMYRPPKLKLLDELIQKMRARLGSDLAPADLSGVRKLIKAVKRGEVIGILPDQEPDKGSGEFAPFFNVPAYTMKLLPQLVKQTGAKVVCCYAIRLEVSSQYDIFFEAADERIYEKDLSTALVGLNSTVEACVRKFPEQYQWEYKRFNTQPEGQPKVYSK